MSPENAQTEVPAEGDLRSHLGGSIEPIDVRPLRVAHATPDTQRGFCVAVGASQFDTASHALAARSEVGAASDASRIGAVGAAGDASCIGAASAEDRVVAFKFGGTSLLGAKRMLHAASLVAPVAQFSQVVVVVSAMKGVTDRLLTIAQSLAGRKNQGARAEAEAVIHLHHDVLHELPLEANDRDRVSYELDSLGRDLLHEVPVQKYVRATPELFDRLASFGERFSARLFAAALECSGVAAVPVSSSEFVLTCDTFQDAKPHLAQTKHRGRVVLSPLLDAGIVPVVTGFIGATPDGRITTLGRNSSDFSGAIIAHVVDADELVIWTDVDGIYTENPNECAHARLLHDLSYDEAHALAESGAKVLHPHVLPLAAETEMTVWVRNTFKPHVRGTRIGSRRAFDHSFQHGPSQHGGAA
jgi:bifunctional aspartokinase / homoserine dehydrogenase 1